MRDDIVTNPETNEASFAGGRWALASLVTVLTALTVYFG